MCAKYYDEFYVLTLWCPQFPYGYSYKAACVRPGFCHCILTLRAECRDCTDVRSYKWRLNPVCHRMLYSCTPMTTVVINRLKNRNCTSSKLACLLDTGSKFVLFRCPYRKIFSKTQCCEHFKDRGKESDHNSTVKCTAVTGQMSSWLSLFWTTEAKENVILSNLMYCSKCSWIHWLLDRGNLVVIAFWVSCWSFLRCLWFFNVFRQFAICSMIIL